METSIERNIRTPDDNSGFDFLINMIFREFMGTKAVMKATPMNSDIIVEEPIYSAIREMNGKYDLDMNNTDNLPKMLNELVDQSIKEVYTLMAVLRSPERNNIQAKYTKSCVTISATNLGIFSALFLDEDM